MSPQGFRYQHNMSFKRLIMSFFSTYGSRLNDMLANFFSAKYWSGNDPSGVPYLTAFQICIHSGY